MSFRSWIPAIVMAAVTMLLGALFGVRGVPAELQWNPAFVEAKAIVHGGSLELPERLHDTAVVDGRAVNVFQPGQTLLYSLALATVGEGAFRAMKVGLIFLFAFSAAVLLRSAVALSGKPPALLALPLVGSLMLGAPYAVSFLTAIASGSVYRVNHVVAIAAISVFLFAITGHRSAWREATAGLAGGLAILFRAQNVFLLVVPLCMLFQSADGVHWRFTAPFRNRLDRMAFLASSARLLAFPLAAVGIVLAFNYARFGDPFESGYLLIYEGRNDYLALRAQQYGVWSLHFLPENLWRTLFAFPSVKLSRAGLQISGDPIGNSLVFSQPILLAVLAVWRSFGDARTQAFAVSAALLTIPVLTYHNPGLLAPGYMRYSLDYVFMWMAAIAVAMRLQTPSRFGVIALWVAATWGVLYGLALVGFPPLSALE